IDFGETVNGFNLREIDVTGGDAINAVIQGDGVYTVTIVAIGDGTVTIDVDAKVARDLAGNASKAASQFVVVVNESSPTPIITGPIGPVNSNPFQVTIDFGEPVREFYLSEIDVTGGTAINAVIHGNGLYTATILPSGDAMVAVNVAASVALDSENNPNTASNSYSVAADTLPPTPIITGPTSLVNSSRFDVTIDFGEMVNGFNLREIDVTGGNAINAVIHGDGSFTATIAAFGDGTVTIDVDDKVARDLAGNTSKAASQFVVVVNESSPTPIITGPIGPVNSNPFQVTIDFGELVREFYLSEIDVTGGTAINAVIHGNGLYTATILPNGDAMVAVNVAASVALDSENNPNTASNSYSVATDTLPPTPVITGPTSPVNSSRFDVTIDFGEMVNGFNLREIDVTGGNAINAVIHGDGLFTATIQPIGEGTITIDVDAKVARDLAGNASRAASQFSVVVNESSPTPIISGPTSLANTSQFEVTIDFGKTVNGFNLREIDVTGGSAINAVDLGNGLFTATINPTDAGTITINIAAGVARDVAGNANLAAIQYSVMVADPPQSEGLGEGARSAWKQTKFARFADEIFAEGSLLDGIMRKKVSDTFLAR
uniref:Ig-like domain-containing protein n=1 Tax=Novipirellula sp. TaxID=2795430 RepID=UPI00356598C1